MIIRTNAGAGPAGGAPPLANTLSDNRNDWVPF
jgi:hypothetical protein